MHRICMKFSQCLFKVTKNYKMYHITAVSSGKILWKRFNVPSVQCISINQKIKKQKQNIPERWWPSWLLFMTRDHDFDCITSGWTTCGESFMRFFQFETMSDQWFDVDFTRRYQIQCCLIARYWRRRHRLC